MQNRRNAAAISVPVDPDDPEQWQAPGLDDPEPIDDILPHNPLPPSASGRLQASSELLDIDRLSKRTRSGTVTKSSLIKAEQRPFPLAATIIRSGDAIPWELRVCTLSYLKEKKN